MLVKTLLKRKPREVITALPSTTVAEAMDLLISNNIGCLPVIDANDRLIGVVSDKDIFRLVHRTGGEYQSHTIGDIMSTELVVGLESDEISYIAGMMDKSSIRHIPIVDGRKMIGLVSQRDIIRTQAQNREIENRYLNLYMEGLGGRDMSGHV